MIYDHDDPRLTAYALGELEPPSRPTSRKYSMPAKKPESMLTKSASLRSGLPVSFRKRLGAPPILSLANHRAIDQTLQQKTSETRKRRWWKSPRALSVVASILVLCCALPVTFTVAWRRDVFLDSRDETAKSKAILSVSAAPAKATPERLDRSTPDASLAKRGRARRVIEDPVAVSRLGKADCLRSELGFDQESDVEHLAEASRPASQVSFGFRENQNGSMPELRLPREA